MRKLTQFLCLAFFLIPASGRSAPEDSILLTVQRQDLDKAAIRWAIRQVETGDRPRAIGPRGERSAYQFMHSTWATHTRRPFILATTDPALAETIAAAHLEAVLLALARRGLPASPRYVAAAWHRGLAFPISAASSNYAVRVDNLYRDRTR